MKLIKSFSDFITESKALRSELVGGKGQKAEYDALTPAEQADLENLFQELKELEPAAAAHFSRKLSQYDSVEQIKQALSSMIADVSRKPAYGSFGDEDGWHDDLDRKHQGEFNFDYDEEEFPTHADLVAKHGETNPWFQGSEERFKDWQARYGGKPFRVRTRKD